MDGSHTDPRRPTEARAGVRGRMPRRPRFPLITIGCAALVGGGLLLWWDRGVYEAASLSTGYTALIALAGALAVTPIHVARKQRRAPAHVPLRRALGVYAGVLAGVHVIVSFPIHLGGSVRRYFFSDDGSILLDRFGLSNWIGLIAMALIAVLLVTSNDFSLRTLGTRRWKKLHRIVYAVGVLVILHTLGYQWIRQSSTILIAALVVLLVGVGAARLLAWIHQGSASR